MSFLGRIARGAAAAVSSSAQRSGPAAGRMLRVGDLVHAPRLAPSAALEPEGWGSDSNAAQSAHEQPGPGVDAMTAGAVSPTATVSFPETRDSRATAVAPTLLAQRTPIEAGSLTHTSFQLNSRGFDAGSAQELRAQAALEQQPASSAASTARSRSDPTAHLAPGSLPSEGGRATELGAAGLPIEAENVVSRGGRQAMPSSAPADRTLGAAPLAAPPERPPAAAQQLQVSAAADADAGSAQPAQHAMQAPQLAQQLTTQQPKAMTHPVTSQPRPAMLAAPRSFEPRPAAPATLPPVVQIGSIEVVVAAPVEPRVAPSAPLRGASFSSRHYLRGL